MDEWIDGWIDGQKEGWINEWTCINVQMMMDVWIVDRREFPTFSILTSKTSMSEAHIPTPNSHSVKHLMTDKSILEAKWICGLEFDVGIICGKLPGF